MIVHPREDWQAPSQPVNGPRPKGTSKTWVIHYPGGGTAPMTDEACASHLRAVQNDYLSSRGYSIGYGWGVGQNGSGWEIRGNDFNMASNPGKKRNDQGTPGNFNNISQSIYVMVTGQDPGTPAAVAKINEIIATHPDWDVIIHGDVDYTSCCGTGLIAQVRDGTIGHHAAPPPTTGDEMTILQVPVRLFDSRAMFQGEKVPGGQHPFEIPAGIPVSDAAMITVTATEADRRGYMTVWASGPRPDASCLNYQQSDSIANTTSVGVKDRKFQLFTSATTHLILDVVGYS